MQQNKNKMHEWKAHDHDIFVGRVIYIVHVAEWAEEREITLLGKPFHKLHDDTKRALKSGSFGKGHRN